jgi:uncharacterized protein YfaS (alpha-2-macroglobulin family)
MNAYKVGASVRCSGAFTNEAGDPVDPTTITFRVRKPDGAVTVYVYGTDAQLVKDGVGAYHVDLAATLAGRWAYRFEGTGAAPSADESLFLVEASRVL